MELTNTLKREILVESTKQSMSEFCIADDCLKSDQTIKELMGEYSFKSLVSNMNYITTVQQLKAMVDLATSNTRKLLSFRSKRNDKELNLDFKRLRAIEYTLHIRGL